MKRSKKGPTNLFRIAYDFIAPLSSVIFMMFGSGFYTTFISLYLDSHKYSKEEIGFVHSAYFLGMLIGGVKMENIINRIGHIQTLAVFGSLATSSILVQALYPNLLLWMAMRFLVGLSIAAIYIVIESWMLDHSSLKTRGVVLSIYMMCLYMAQSVSQQFLSLMDINSYTPFLIAALFTSLSVIPVGLSIVKVTPPHPHEMIKFKEIIKISPFGVVGCFVSGLILSSIYSFFPIFASSRNISSENLMTITIAGGVLLQWPIGKLSDHFERRKALVATVIVTMLITLGTFFYHGTSPTTLLALCFLIGGFSFTLSPLSMTQICDHLSHSQITKATSLSLVIYGLGCVFGPLISSTVIELFNIDYILLFYTVILGALALLGIYLVFTRPEIPVKEHNAYVPLPNVTNVAFELDPRSDTK